MNKFLLISLLLLVSSMPAAAQGTGSSLTLPISLPGGLLGGAVTGQLTVSFESVNGLTPDHLGASAQLVSLLDPSLLSRLPSLVSLLSGFPVLVRVEPPAAGGLAFNGVTTVEVVTASLPLLSAPRLYTAPLGGNFQDITTSVVRGGSGMNRNYRVQGTSGGFSEFLVILDLTPVDQVIGAKLDRLDQILAANAGAMPDAVHADLASQLAAIRSLATPGNETAAIQALDNFNSTVTAHSGTDIPDLWRSIRDVVNVAGQLRAAAATLQFSLGVRQGSS
ncbi:MAG: DUF6689 family protein [Thermoanaerobaculia bacterium]